MTSPSQSSTVAGGDPRRLDSWKEIAAFFGRDVRTVRRWESERSLPVHRVPGGERSRVFAYVFELETWLTSTSAETGLPPSETRPAAAEATPTPEAQAISSVRAGSAAAFPVDSQTIEPSTSTPSEPVRDASGTQAAPTGSFPLRRILFTAVLVVLVLASVGVVAMLRTHTVASAHTSPHQPTPEVEDLYLRGRYFWDQRTEESLNRAVDLFTQAIVRDPKYASAYAGLADAYLLLRQYGNMADTDAYPRALAAARQAVALDETSPGAHRSLAFIDAFWLWDMHAAEAEFRRAIALNPRESQTHHWFATALLSYHRYPEALEHIDLARELEPQSSSVLADRGLIMLANGNRAGIEALQQVEQTDPNFVSPHSYLANTALRDRDYSGYLEEMHRAAEIKQDADLLVAMDRASRTLEREGAEAMLRELGESYATLARRHRLNAFNAARVYAVLQDVPKTLQALSLTCQRREPNCIDLAEDADFLFLHGTPEFTRLLQATSARLPGVPPAP